jgi:hypothetical protein
MTGLWGIDRILEELKAVRYFFGGAKSGVCQIKMVKNLE